MNIEFTSILSQPPHISDNRVLFFEIEFHSVPHNTVTSAAIEFYRSIERFQKGQFISCYDINGRKKRNDQIEQTILGSSGRISYISESAVIGPEIANQADFRRARRRLLLDPTTPRLSFYSLDYPEYFQKKISPIIKDDAMLKQAILELFAEPRQRCIGYNHGVDAQGLFIAGCHTGKRNPALYFGKMCYCIVLESCGQYLNDVADVFSKFVIEICELLKYANGRVGKRNFTISASFSPYMDYFGQLLDFSDNSHLEHRYMPFEWYPYYYLSGVEWMNCVSELTMSHMTFREVAPQDEKLVLEWNVRGGHRVFQVNCPIQEVGLDGIAAMKRKLYPVLYPGKSVFNIIERFSEGNCSYSMLPRSSWEIIPIWEEEITVKNGIITFAHCHLN